MEAPAGAHSKESDVKSTSNSRHLVDPEIVPFLESFTPFDLRTETLPQLRESQQALLPGVQEVAARYPLIDYSEEWVPGAPGDPQVRVLVFCPRALDEPAPGVLWIHGGGFVLGSAETDLERCFQLAAQLQAVVVSVDYRLAPEAQGTQLAEDCYAALLWLWREHQQLGVDANRIAVVGMSAGGGLAAATALMARDRGQVPVCLQALVYPMLDDRTAAAAAPHPYTGEFLWTHQNNHFGWTSILGHQPGCAEAPPYVVPARASDLSELAPAFIAVGALDLFLQENLSYAQRLIHAGIPTELHVYPGGYHAFDAVPEARISRQLLGDLHHALETTFRATT